MDKQRLVLSVFTKPWMNASIPEIGKMVSGLGFDGIEFPLRPGYQVEPENAERGLAALVKQLGEYGIRVTSVASETSERVFAGCAAAGIPIIRIMGGLDIQEGFWASLDKLRKKIEGFIPLCEKYRVKVGIQHHYGPMISTSMELRHLLDGFDRNHVGAIWDSAHSALAGELPEIALDIVWDYLYMVNLKNAFYLRANGPEADSAEWKRYFTSGRQGLASWPRIVKCLEERKYEGVLCLTAEYTEEERVNKLIADDVAYLKSILGSHA